MASDTHGGIWAGVAASDAPALIEFLTETFGFVADLVVPGESDDQVIHSQITWPEGGTVMVGSTRSGDDPFANQPTGVGNIYVITSDPDAVYQRCREAGVEIAREPASPEYDPGGTAFTARDPEGNLWSFGTYSGET